MIGGPYGIDSSLLSTHIDKTFSFGAATMPH
ncbi:23S rRNA (pseudouridine(1915)-N(3))-methyltransferase RlmH [bacterium]|nr:23S rRNA (pseudouridine(1915)-N(3))-methyltransferase RlmH [bacterium]